MRIVSVIIIALFILGTTYSGCSDQQKLTKLETEFLSALIINFQNVAPGSVNPEQPENTLYLLKHIAHIKGTLTASLAYAMAINAEGRIVAHNMLGNQYSVGQKLDDATTKNVLAYHDPNKPYFQFFISENNVTLIDISLPVMPEDDGSVPEGYVRIGIFKSD